MTAVSASVPRSPYSAPSRKRRRIEASPETESASASIAERINAHLARSRLSSGSVTAPAPKVRPGASELVARGSASLSDESHARKRATDGFVRRGNDPVRRSPPPTLLREHIEAKRRRRALDVSIEGAPPRPALASAAPKRPPPPSDALEERGPFALNTLAQVAYLRALSAPRIEPPARTRSLPPPDRPARVIALPVKAASGPPVHADAHHYFAPRRRSIDYPVSRSRRPLGCAPVVPVSKL